MKKCIFLYRQRYLSYLVLLLLLWPTVMLAAQGNIQIKGKFSLKEAIRYIEETSDYTFFYKDSDLKDKSKKEINCSGTIEEVLKNLFNGSGVNYIIKGKEEEISSKIKEQYNLENFVKIKDDQVRVVIIKNEHDSKLANDIMNLVQKNFDSKMYISIKFQK